MKIVIDAFGGDYAPLEIVEGAVLAIKKFENLEIILTGDQDKLNNLLAGRSERITVVDAKDVITNDDVPTEAIRHKKESSLVKAFDILKENDDVIAMISAGSTGAILTGAIMKIGRIKGISRPCLAPILPTKKGDRKVMLADSGANIDCKPINLCHFAIMGSAYYSIMYGEKSPRVALLNNGTEEHKGCELVRATYPLMKQLPINFIGNVEGREYMSGDVDVMVADGFAGNVLLKGTEGAVAALLSQLKSSIKSSFSAKIGYLFMKGAFNKLKSKIDINTHGGSPFLGVKKLIMKNHGTSKRSNIVATVENAIFLHEQKLIEKITESVQSLNLEVQE